MNLFPMIQPELQLTSRERPMYREIKWDFEANAPVFKGGSPVEVTGAQAVLVWAWKALQTPRFRHEVYTWGYGCEAEALIGQPYTDELKQAEAARYVRECLMINPYITDVTGITIAFEENNLQIFCKISTIYGEVSLRA